jgi:hypothetical protein
MVAHALEHGRHGARHMMPPAAEAQHWLWMVVAMMFPLLGDPLRTVHFRSFPNRRVIAAASFLLGYTLVWALAGVPVVWLRAQAWTHHLQLAALAFAFGAGWVCTRFHRWGQRACHAKRALSAWGWRAQRDAAAYGVRVGMACVVTCWPLMLACTLTGHALVAMLGGLLAGAIERIAFRPARRRVLAVVCCLACWYTALTLLDARAAHVAPDAHTGSAALEGASPTHCAL